MRKTSIYLSDDETERLRRLAASTGKSQAELIREGLRSVLTESDQRPRTFHSLGHGHGGGVRSVGWEADELYRRRLSDGV